MHFSRNSSSFSFSCESTFFASHKTTTRESLAPKQEKRFLSSKKGNFFQRNIISWMQSLKIRWLNNPKSYDETLFQRVYRQNKNTFRKVSPFRSRGSWLLGWPWLLSRYRKRFRGLNFRPILATINNLFFPQGVVVVVVLQRERKENIMEKKDEIKNESSIYKGNLLSYTPFMICAFTSCLFCLLFLLIWIKTWGPRSFCLNILRWEHIISFQFE